MPFGDVKTGFRAGFDGSVTEHQVEALTRLTRRGQRRLPAAWLDVPLPCCWVGRVWGSVYLAWDIYPCRGPLGLVQINLPRGKITTVLGGN